MRGYGQPGWSLGFGRPWTPAVRAIILACGGIWVGQVLLARTGLPDLLALDTARPLEPWRYVTYLFLHGGVFHLLFNMLAVWMLGSDLEERLGARRFVAYYLATGAGAGATVTLLDLLLGRRDLSLLRSTQPDVVIPLRSTVQDIGPVLTHRTKIVRLALEGKTMTEICQFMHHSPQAISNYLSTFIRCAQLAHNEHASGTDGLSPAPRQTAGPTVPGSPGRVSIRPEQDLPFGGTPATGDLPRGKKRRRKEVSP